MKISVYTDGACSKDGIGGYGIAIIANTKTYRFSERFENTTNNKMELGAISKALELLKEKISLDGVSSIEVFSDSQYCIRSINEWLPRWEQNGFYVNDPSKNVKNIPEWKRFTKIRDSLSDVELKFIWVKGHAENEINNIVDRLAVNARLDKELVNDF